MIWFLYVIVHSIAQAYFNSTFILGLDFHVSQVMALSVDLIALFYFMYRPINMSWLTVLELSFIYTSLRWIVYDICLNLLLGKSIFYIGSGGLDNTFGAYQYGMKFILLIVLIVIFIKKIKK